MIVNPFAGDRPVVHQDPGASRERGEAFQRAYEKVFDERSAQASVRPAGNAYAVRAGDTLTNIVRDGAELVLPVGAQIGRAHV